MTREPYSAPNYDDLVQYLAPPFYLRAAPYIRNLAPSAFARSSKIAAIKETTPSVLPITIVIRSGGA